MQPDEDIQSASRSRPVSFYDNYKVVPVMPLCVTSAMSVGNLNQVRDENGTSAVSQSNNNNINSNNINNNNNNRVSSAVSVGNVSKINTIKVTGAVSTGNIGRISRGDKEKELNRAPSMANCLSTTVPVNLAASQIAGRHTPTRNSLRHSRMIVMHRTGHHREKILPPLLYHRRLARCLAALQTILGVAVMFLSLWLLLWTPNLPIVDNPYWSGIPLLMSGSCGLSLLYCFKKEHPGMRPGFCLSATKVFSLFFAVLATIACLSACVFSAMHLTRLMGLECTPAQVLNATCVCRPRGEPPDSFERAVRYMDLNCPEVEGILTGLLTLSCISNVFGFLTAGWYIYLHWNTRYKKPLYVQVKTNNTCTENSFSNRQIYKPKLEQR